MHPFGVVHSQEDGSRQQAHTNPEVGSGSRGRELLSSVFLGALEWVGGLWVDASLWPCHLPTLWRGSQPKGRMGTLQGPVQEPLLPVSKNENFLALSTVLSLISF